MLGGFNRAENYAKYIIQVTIFLFGFFKYLLIFSKRLKIKYWKRIIAIPSYYLWLKPLNLLKNKLFNLMPRLLHDPLLNK